MTGILFGTGIGPGDPELMTLKAVRLIREMIRLQYQERNRKRALPTRLLFRQCRNWQKRACCYSNADDKECQRTEGKSPARCRKIEELLDAGKNVVFLTLGDPTVYSTYLYVHRRVLEDGYDARIVSGVTSFCAAAASLSEGLVENSEELHVIPASYQIEDALELSGTKVLMKAGKKMPAVKQFLKERTAGR